MTRDYINPTPWPAGGLAGDFILFCFHHCSFVERVVRKESRILDVDLVG